jgi:hypothetical protein
VSITCGITTLPLVIQGKLTDTCFPLYAMMTNVDSCSPKIPTKARWSEESSFYIQGAVKKKRYWRHILRLRRGILLHVQYSVTRRWKNGVARPVIYCAA